MSTEQIKSLPLSVAIKTLPLAELLAVIGNPHFASALAKAYQNSR